jgi:PGF-pre-PGF domain-containing protein
MHDPIARRLAVSLLLLCICAGSLAESLNTRSRGGVGTTLGPVVLPAVYADGGGSCTDTTTTTSTIPPSTVTQSTTVTYTQTVGRVTQLSYLYDTITSATTVYRTQTVSTTSTTRLYTTLTRSSTAFATTQTTSVAYYETESTTQTQTSYATISVTQYVYLESYVPGQVIEYATIQRTSNGSEGSAHFSKDDEHKIQTITITVVGNLTNAKIAIATVAPHTSVGANKNEYSSFQIAATNLPDDNIRSVVIEFKVERNWLSNNEIPQDKINLYRYENGEWRRLETSLLRTDGKYAYYKAVSPGLSIFVIAGQPSSFLQIPVIGWIPVSYALTLSIIIIAILGAYGAIRIRNARRRSGPGEQDLVPPPAETRSEDEVDTKLLEYITQHGGSITLSKTAEDLGVPPATIKEAISRLKDAGKLTPA